VFPEPLAVSLRRPSNILITGATGGIGGALAEAYAAPGIYLALHGQNRQRLDEVATSCRAQGARVLARSFNITDIPALTEWIRVLEAETPLDLVITSQGKNTNIGMEGQGECWEAVDELMSVNVQATMALVHAVLPGMRRRGRGQIALISSLAAYYGLPITPSYSASKAAVKAYGEALRGWLAPEGICVNVVMPGYVESRMCREMPGPKPFLWSPERAARVIRRGLERNQARISFPFPLSMGTWWLAVLPPSVSERIVRYLGYRG
jgi:short-subunit dehydrogenase